MIAVLKERLKRELTARVEELTVRIPARLGTDQRFDDYQAIVEEQQRIQRRIHFLHQALAQLDKVEPHMVPARGAGFGSTVGLRDLATGVELSYTLMLGDSVNLEAGEISLASPVGYALLGRKVGENIQVSTPLGRRSFHIVAVTTLLDDTACGDSVRELLFA